MVVLPVGGIHTFGPIGLAGPDHAFLTTQPVQADFNRLLFRSFFGSGVLCVLVVTQSPDSGKVNLVFGTVLALDCMGDPVYVPKTVTFPLDENCGKIFPIRCGSSCVPQVSAARLARRRARKMTTRRPWFALASAICSTSVS